jgi:hypothetical protein
MSDGLFEKSGLVHSRKLYFFFYNFLVALQWNQSIRSSSRMRQTIIQEERLRQRRICK